MSETPAGGGQGCGCGTGCLVSLVLLAALSAFLIFRYTRSGGEIEPVVDRFLELVAAEGYRSAYDMVGETWRSGQDFDGFAEFQRDTRSRLGELESRTRTSLGVKTGTPSGTTAVAVYDARYSKGNVTLTFRLAKRDDLWLIEGQEYASPSSESRAGCPRCGREAGPDALFCSQCGAELDDSARSLAPAAPREAPVPDAGPEPEGRDF